MVVNFTLSESLRAGWASFKNHAIPSIIFFVSSFLIIGVFSAVFRFMHPSLGLLPLILLSPLVDTAYCNVHFLWKSGQVITTKSFLAHVSLKLWVHYIIVSLIVSFAVGLGFFLFVIPGLYILIRLMFVVPALVDNPSEGFSVALKKSWEMTNGSVCNLSVYLLVSVLIMILASITIVGVIVVIPVLQFARAEIYWNNKGGEQLGESSSTAMKATDPQAYV